VAFIPATVSSDTLAPLRSQVGWLLRIKRTFSARVRVGAAVVAVGGFKATGMRGPVVFNLLAPLKRLGTAALVDGLRPRLSDMVEFAAILYDLMVIDAEN
jgi:hypothetical protein